MATPRPLAARPARRLRRQAAPTSARTRTAGRPEAPAVPRRSPGSARPRGGVARLAAPVVPPRAPASARRSPPVARTPRLQVDRAPARVAAAARGLPRAAVNAQPREAEVAAAGDHSVAVVVADGHKAEAGERAKVVAGALAAVQRPLGPAPTRAAQRARPSRRLVLLSWCWATASPCASCPR